MKQDFYLANYHTHTPRCHHATGAEEEYVLQALACGYDTLGFADHCCWPYASDFVSPTRMRLDELEDYVSTVRALKEKYAGRIRIHLGLECEAFPQFYAWMREIRAQGLVEYFILGNHYDTTDEDGLPYFGHLMDRDRAYRYMETTISGMESGLFTYLCHPDLFLNRFESFDADAKYICRALCDAARRLNLPLEYNLLGKNRQSAARSKGRLGYTTRQFWEIAAETGNRAIIGVDAHSPDELNCIPQYIESRNFLADLGIETLDRLPQIEQS